MLISILKELCVCATGCPPVASGRLQLIDHRYIPAKFTYAMTWPATCGLGYMVK